TRRGAPSGRRVPAADLERLIEERLTQFFASEAEVFGAIEPLVGDVNDCTNVVARAASLAKRWPDLDPAEKRAILTTLVDRIDLMRETVDIRICPGQLPALLRAEVGPGDLKHTPDSNEPSITFTVPARLKRAGRETRLLVDGAGISGRRQPD